MSDNIVKAITMPSAEYQAVQDARHEHLVQVLNSMHSALKRHTQLFQSAEERDKEAAEDAKRARLAGSVSDNDNDNDKGDGKDSNGAGTGTSPKKDDEAGGGGGLLNNGGLMGALSGLLGGTIAGMSTKKFFKGLGKKVIGLGIAAAIAPAVGNFIEGAVNRSLEGMDVDPQVGNEIASGLNFAAVNAIIAATINRRWALPAFLASLAYKVGAKLDEIDGEDDNVIAGVEVSDETMGIVSGILGVGIGIYLQNKLVALAKAAAAKIKGTPVDDIVDEVTDTTVGVGQNDTKGGGNNNKTDRAKLNDKLNKRQTDLINKGIRLPGFMSFNSNGQAINSQGFASNAEVKAALERLDKMNVSKYAGLLKFAGAAASVGFSMVDVYDAIANGESEDVIIKELSGALGGIAGGFGGAKLGALAGLMAGGPIGSFLGALVMGGFGALAGEDLAEMIAEFAVTGKSEGLDKLGNTLAVAGSGFTTGQGFMGNPAIMGKAYHQQAKETDFESLKSGDMSFEKFNKRHPADKKALQRAQAIIDAQRAEREERIRNTVPVGLGVLRPENLKVVPMEDKVDAMGQFSMFPPSGGQGSMQAVQNFSPVQNTVNTVGGNENNQFNIIQGGTSSLDNSIPVSQ
ncbi:hypothetical protein N9000_00200 [bacterium]|nr:hypothetical protein [bacterium]